jgi:tetratricopeptide (TPR) repeat protein
MPSRIEMLRAFIAQRPQDPFPRYALALEHKNAGDLELAWDVFRGLIENHADYTAAYLHAGTTLLALGRRGEAREILENGLAVCRRRGDHHAAGELEGVLAGLGRP